MTRFWKVEAVGNSFVLVHSSEVEGIDLAAFAIRVCEQRFGVGSDGLLVVGPDLILRMFNPDGTEDFCGNGLRCAADHIVRQGWASGSFVIRHLGINVPAHVHSDGLVEVTLAPASFEPSLVPLSQPQELWQVRRWGHLASSLSTGTTHTVLNIDELPGEEEFMALSPTIENDPVFPDRTSLMWMQTLAPGRLRLRIWERGAGETWGCGTGSSAAAVVHSRATGYTGRIEVQNPGGIVFVTLDHWQGTITMASKTHVSYEGVWPA